MSQKLERVQVLLPSHQAFQLKAWASNCVGGADAFDLEPDQSRVEIASDHQLDKWGNPRVRVYLAPTFAPGVGWTVGWFCNADDAVDEYIVGNPVPLDYPWYRPPEASPSGERLIAMASAARMAKIVLEQMKGHVQAECAKIIQFIQDRLEALAMDWLQYPLGVEPVFFENQKCVVVQTSSLIPTWLAGCRVVIVKVNADTRSCWVREDKPIRHKINGRGRRVVEYDPRCVQSVISWRSLEPIW